MTRHILDRILHAAAPLVAFIGNFGAWYGFAGRDIVLHPLREFMRCGDPSQDAYLMYQHAAQVAVLWGWTVAVICVGRGRSVVPEEGGDGAPGRHWR